MYLYAHVDVDVGIAVDIALILLLLDDSSFRMTKIHLAIQGLIRLAPTSTTTLLNALAYHFPHKRFDINHQNIYTSQLLKIASYLPTSRQIVIFDLLISKCLEIDVEIVIEDSGESKLSKEVEDEDELVAQMFGMNDDDDDNNDNVGGVGMDSFNLSSLGVGAGASSGSAMRKAIDVSQRIPDAVVDMADKLDAMLTHLVDYIGILMNTNGRTGGATLPTATTTTTTTAAAAAAAAATTANVAMDEETYISSDSDEHDSCNANDELFQQILSVFEDKILSTHRSKFVQFIVFYVAGRSPNRFGCALCNRLLKLFLDHTLSSLRRQSAVVYLASILARCSSLREQFVKYVILPLVSRYFALKSYFI